MSEDAQGHPRAIGRYRVDGLLGRGAMGMVYLARDEAIERDVAIKTIHRELLQRADAEAWVARFKSEVRAAGRCLHPNIVTVFEYGEREGVPYIVMEFVEGRELRDFLKARRPLSPANAAAVMVQVLRALDHAHQQGVVHRDIKPANIIVLNDGQVKVTDFGIARMVHGDDPLEQHAFAVGTPGYMAPEQFRGHDVDGRADLYSAGVVFFEMLTGKRPFRRRDDRDLPQQVLRDRPPRVTSLNPRLPPELDAVMERALAKKPDDRFQRAEDMLDAVERLGLIDRELSAHDPGRRATRVLGGLATRPTWDEDHLGQLERWLVERLGPVARVMVRRRAEVAQDAADLVDPLAAAIPEESERQLFSRRAHALLGSVPTRPSPNPGATAEYSQMTWALGPFDRETLEAARQALAIHLGPIAKVMVKRAAPACKTTAELYERLAEHLPTDADRAAFLARAPRPPGDRG